MSIFYKLPNGQQVKLPRAGETVQVFMPGVSDKWLPAIVDARDTPSGDEVKLDLIVFVSKFWPNKVHFRKDVPHSYFHDGQQVVWNHIPQA